MTGSFSTAMGASPFCADLKIKPMHDTEYGSVLKSIRPPRDLKLSNKPVQSQLLWNKKSLVDGPSEDSSRCSDYSSCSDLCSSPESSTDGFNLDRTPFNSLPNHHLLSPFAPFVRREKSDSRKKPDPNRTSRQTQTFPTPGSADVVVKQDEISRLPTFENSYKRLVVDCRKQSHEDKYFHPIREASDVAGHPGKLDLVSETGDTLSVRRDTPSSQECIQAKPTITSIPNLGSSDNSTNLKLNVAQSMTDLFCRDDFTAEPFKRYCLTLQTDFILNKDRLKIQNSMCGLLSFFTFGLYMRLAFINSQCSLMSVNLVLRFIGLQQKCWIRCMHWIIKRTVTYYVGYV